MIDEKIEINGKIGAAGSIINSVLYGDSRGYGYAHPTPREYFEARLRESEAVTVEVSCMCGSDRPGASCEATEAVKVERDEYDGMLDYQAPWNP